MAGAEQFLEQVAEQARRTRVGGRPQLAGGARAAGLRRARIVSAYGTDRYLVESLGSAGQAIEEFYVVAEPGSVYSAGDVVELAPLGLSGICRIVASGGGGSGEGGADVIVGYVGFLS